MNSNAQAQKNDYSIILSDIILKRMSYIWWWRRDRCTSNWNFFHSWIIVHFSHYSVINLNGLSMDVYTVLKACSAITIKFSIFSNNFD